MINNVVHEINPYKKAQQLFDKFRTIVIDNSNDKINNEIANTIALMSVKMILDELNFYMSNTPKPELRPTDLSGKQFWEDVSGILQRFHVYNYDINNIEDATP